MRAFGSAVGTTVVTLGALAGTTAAIGGAGLMVVKRLVKHQEVCRHSILSSICSTVRRARQWTKCVAGPWLIHCRPPRYHQ